MEKVIANYETLFIVDATLEEEAQKALIEKFSTLISENGEIDTVNEWGKRKLAYPINDMTEGYYVLINFKAETSFVAELERVYNMTDGIMRSMVVRL